MNGSEKQIKWAEQIRADMMSNIMKTGIADQLQMEKRGRERAAASGKSLVKIDAMIADLESMKAAIEAQESASWFIDNRAILNGFEKWGKVVLAITGAASKYEEATRK